MAANRYLPGNIVRLRGQFDISAIPTNPTAVTVYVKDPEGAVTNPPVVNDSAGIYHADFTTAKHGVHKYGFRGTGAVVAYGESAFIVEHSEFL